MICRIFPFVGAALVGFVFVTAAFVGSLFAPPATAFTLGRLAGERHSRGDGWFLIDLSRVGWGVPGVRTRECVEMSRLGLLSPCTQACFLASGLPARRRLFPVLSATSGRRTRRFPEDVGRSHWASGVKARP